MEAMATKNRQIAIEEKTSEPPSDNKLFADEGSEQPSEHEVFAGDEDFLNQLANSGQPAVGQQPTGTSRFLPALVSHKRFSTAQKALIAGIVMIGAILSYGLLKSPSKSVTSRSPAPAGQIAPDTRQTLPAKLPAESSPRIIEQQVQKPEPAPPPAQPLSLKVAETLYREKNYNEAFDTYDQLRKGLPTTPQGELIEDFLQLRMALCMKKTADFAEADRLLATALKSRSPIVKAVANYHRSLLEIQKKQYLKAQSRAYQTLALLGAIVLHRERTLALNRDCHFLVAESITRNVLSLCDADKDLPPKLWSGRGEVDPFANISDAELRPFLNSGLEQLSKGLLGPQVQKLINPDKQGPPRWSVTCRGAPIEELLTRFAANADLDINWASNLNLAGARRRPVNLYLPATTTQQFAKVAAGCAGLLARLDENGVVNIFNPAEYSSLSEHVSLLTEEAISLWQRFVLTFYDDKCIPNAHFALGLLQAQKGQVTDAIAEYKLVANRFSRTSLAPFALLHSSKLKTNLCDYPGARDDLEQLIEQDPDTEIADQACLYLADVTMKAGLNTEATRLYRKVYNLGFSSESQTDSALGAGICFYQMKDFQSAAKWLTRYISLARDNASKELYSAYFLLGKSNLASGKTQQARDALQYALAGQLSKEEYVETIPALVKVHLELGNFIQALDILENIKSWQLSQEESIEILLLKSETLRTMGLVDKAITALRNRAEYIADGQLKTKVSFELAKCHIAQGNLELARTSLTEILINVDPGPLAHEAVVTLADVCLKLGQNSQAVSVCLQLLNLDPSAQIRQEALNILATAYNRQKNYDKAALALSGQWNGAETPGKKRMLDNTAPADKSPTKAR